MIDISKKERKGLLYIQLKGEVINGEEAVEREEFYTLLKMITITRSNNTVVNIKLNIPAVDKEVLNVKISNPFECHN